MCISQAQRLSTTLNLCVSDSEVSPTNYVIHEMDLLNLNEFETTNMHEERQLIPLVFAHIKGNRHYHDIVYIHSCYKVVACSS